MNYLKKLTLAVALILAFAFISGTAGYAQDPNQVRCPVMGGAANKRVYTDYQGKRVYFCCPPCIQQFHRNPERYMKQFEKEGVILEDAPRSKKE